MSEPTPRALADKIIDSISITLSACGYSYESKLAVSTEGREKIAQLIDRWYEERIHAEALESEIGPVPAQVREDEALVEIKRVLNETNCSDSQFLEIMHQIAALRSRQSPQAWDGVPIPAARTADLLGLKIYTNESFPDGVIFINRKTLHEALAAAPQPSPQREEAEHEPGETITTGHCPCCGAGLEVIYGEDEGEIGIIGEDKSIKGGRTMAEREVRWWGPPEAERLYASDKDEAIESILDDFDEPPETVVVCGYAEMKVNFESYGPLEDVLESLDEEYGDPDGDRAEATEAMIEAEEAFMAVIAKEYKTWACEEVSRETINIAEWRSAQDKAKDLAAPEHEDSLD